MWDAMRLFADVRMQEQDGVHRVWKLNAYNCNVMGLFAGVAGAGIGWRG